MQKETKQNEINFSLEKKITCEYDTSSKLNYVNSLPYIVHWGGDLLKEGMFILFVYY